MKQSAETEHLLDQGRHVQCVIGHPPRPAAQPRAVVPLRRPHLGMRRGPKH